MIKTRKEIQDDRLYSQFATSERLIEFLDIIREAVEETDDMIEQTFLYRFKDTAYGVWLDWVAEIIGVFSRPNAEYQPEDMFSYRSLSDPQFSSSKGYGTMFNMTTGGRYRSLYGNKIPGVFLDDKAFLTVINTKIAANTSGSDIPSIWDYVYKGFGVKVDIDSSVGLVEVYFRPEERKLTDFERRILVEYAPVLMGCKIVLRNWI